MEEFAISNENKETSPRLNQWFIRGIGFVTTALFVLILIFSLLEFDQSLFGNDLIPVLEFDYIIIAKQIGNYIWTFRVYDLLLITILIVLASIAVYYTTLQKSINKPRKHRRTNF
jgi:hypothetical protein